MNSGLIASYLAVGSLFISGCGSNTEYHEGSLSGGTFKLEVKHAEENNSKSRLELISSNKKIRSVIDSVGAPIYSTSPFTVVSMKVYQDDKIFRDYTPSERKENSHYGSHIERDLQFVFKSGAGREAMTRACLSDYLSVLEHLERCNGQKPCSVPRKK